MKVQKHILFIFFLGIFISCGDDEMPGTVGEPITMAAESLESSSDLDISWSILEQPSASWLSPEDARLSSGGLEATFVPDEPGKYVFQVSISQYGDELSTQSFTYNIEPSTETAAAEPYEEVTEDEWLSTSQDEPTAVVADDTAKPEQVPETTMAVTPPPPPAPPKQVVKQAPKVIPGATIPYDKTRFTIQVAARNTLEDAEKVAADLIDAGFDAYIQKATFVENDQTWYRVRVGSYDDRKVAQAVANSIQEQHELSTWIDHVRLDQ